MVFASRDVIQRVGSKPFTSPAKCVANAVWSKWVMGPMPDLPARSPCQVSSVPMATGVTSPMPVTTTLRAHRRSMPPFIVYGADAHGAEPSPAALTWRAT